MPHSVPIGTSFASSLNLFKESSSPSNITILSRSTLIGLFLLIVPSITIEPAICPNLGDLKISFTSSSINDNFAFASLVTIQQPLLFFNYLLIILSILF